MAVGEQDPLAGLDSGMGMGAAALAHSVALGLQHFSPPHDLAAGGLMIYNSVSMHYGTDFRHLRLPSWARCFAGLTSTQGRSYFVLYYSRDRPAKSHHPYIEGYDYMDHTLEWKREECVGTRSAVRFAAQFVDVNPRPQRCRLPRTSRWKNPLLHGRNRLAGACFLPDEISSCAKYRIGVYQGILWSCCCIIAL